MEATIETPRKKATFSSEEVRALHDRTGVDQTVSTAEAAILLGVAPQSLRRWACHGSGPLQPRRAFGRLRWAVSDIARVMAGTAA